MALLSFPSNPGNGQFYPVTPVIGQNQYQWSSAEQIWKLLGAAVGVTPGCYGDGYTVPSFCVDFQGRVTSVTNIPIAANTPDLQQVTTQGAVTTDTIDVGGLIAASLTYPSTDGVANQVLSTDGGGNLGWLSTAVLVAPPATSLDPGNDNEISFDAAGNFYFFKGGQWWKVVGASF